MGAQANFLYYAPAMLICRRNAARQADVAHAAEAAAGIHRFDEPAALDIGAQVIELSELDPARLDPRLHMPGLDALRGATR